MSHMKRLMEEYTEVFPELQKLTKHQMFTLMFFAGYNPHPLKTFEPEMFWKKIQENIFFRKFVTVNYQKNFLKDINYQSIFITKRTILVVTELAHMECEAFLSMSPQDVASIANQVANHLYGKRSKIQALDKICSVSRAIRRTGECQ